MIFCFCVLAINLRGQDFSVLSFGQDETFDFATWNIEWFPKSGTTAGFVEEILTAYDLDLIAFQEISDTTLFRETLENIGGYEVHFASEYYGGLAWAWKPDVVTVNQSYEIYTQSTYWAAFPRSPQVLEVSAFGEEYVFVNNHLKCCGDGTLDTSLPYDEENRRFEAIQLLKNYADGAWFNRAVVILGDLNDELTDTAPNNVFQPFLDDPNYAFADYELSTGGSYFWSYPSWPSHLDHILVSNELIPLLATPDTEVTTLRPDDAFSSWFSYDNSVSDHRPVAMRYTPGQLTAPSLAAQSIALYPNPVRDHLILELPAHTEEVLLFDSFSRLIHTLSGPFSTIFHLNVVDLAPGVYFFRVKTRDANMMGTSTSSATLRFVKQ